MGKPLLEIHDLSVHFGGQYSVFFPKPTPQRAVDGISFSLYPGEALGIVGESGCGKTTLARAVLKLLPTTSGQIVWMGRDLDSCSPNELHEYRREAQIIFQDPFGSLNPRMTVGSIIAEPLRALRPELPRPVVLRRVKDVMSRVGLSPGMINRYPHEFSGGQCQRIGIARAVVLRPKLIVCDEPVSALDVSIQAQIINLLRELQTELGLSLIFISHDLAIVKYICHRVLVLYLGKVMEHADTHRLFTDPMHPYTRALMAAVPVPDPAVERERQPFELPRRSAPDPSSGCVFRARCPMVREKCVKSVPVLEKVAAGHETACHFWRELPRHESSKAEA